MNAASVCDRLNFPSLVRLPIRLNRHFLSAVSSFVLLSALANVSLTFAQCASVLPQNVAIASGDYHTLLLKSDGTVWAAGYNYDGELGEGFTNSDTASYVQVLNIQDIISVSAVGYGSTALGSNGTVWTWGYNSDGELGNGTNNASKTPVPVSGLSHVIAIAGGEYHEMALKSDGTVWSWGSNSNGQLGNGTNTSSNIPVQVSGLTNVIAIACGRYFSMALKSDGTIWCWGDNSSGDLGNGTTTDSTTPVQVSGFTGGTSIAGGDGFALARKSDGTVWAWGDNTNGCLGNGTNTSSSTPIQSSTPTGIISISARNDHVLAQRGDATIWAWGSNTYGQLGNGGTTNSTTPVQVPNVTGVAVISAGGYHSTVLKDDGSVSAWGYDSYDSAFGTAGPITQTDSPSPFYGLTSVTAVASAKAHYLALQSTGTVWSWGDTTLGQTGNGTSVGAAAPVQVSGLTGISAIACGSYSNYALKSGTVWAWGKNNYGQLGNSTTTDSATPVQVTGLTGITAIYAGAYFAMAIKSDGTLWTWGYNGHGELGVGSTSNSDAPVQVTSLSSVTKIAAGSWHAVALESNGTVWAWGANYYGELGNGTATTGSTSPAQVAGVSGVTSIAAGYFNSMALQSNGSLYCWGYNEDGELNSGSGANSSVPVLSNVSGAFSISMGEDSFHALALMSDGSVYAWGANINGQLGQGEYSPDSGSSKISGLTGVTGLASSKFGTLACKSDGTMIEWGDRSYQPFAVAVPQQAQFAPAVVADRIQSISGGKYHSLEIEDGQVWAWGSNVQGQLGDGTLLDQPTPVPIYGMPSVAGVAAGAYHSLALSADGHVWAWGSNGFGQLGDGGQTNKFVPELLSSLSNVTAVAAGDWHSLALKSDGTVWAWGYNNDGELGNNSTAQSSVPVQVSGLTGIRAIAVRGYHSLALKSDGTIWTWGYNSSGQLGNGTTTSQLVPVQVSGVTTAKFVSSGEYFSSTIESDGSVWTWGDNTYGQIGDGTNTNHSTPYSVQLSGSTLNNAVMLASGDNHIVVACADGSLVAFGADYSGQLGDGSTNNKSTPEVLPSYAYFGVIAVSAGSIDTFAVQGSVAIPALTSDQILAWGDDSLGELGDGKTGNTDSPRIQAYVLNRNLLNNVAVSADASLSVALKTDGTVWTWGTNSYGEMGNGTDTISSPLPEVVPDIYNITAIASDSTGVLALKSDGTVWSWGVTGGVGNSSNTAIPIAIPNLSSVIGIAASTVDAVVKSDGTVWAWGASPFPSTTPTQISGISGAKAVAPFAALLSNGTIWTWANNSTTGVQNTSLSGITAISGDSSLTVGLKNDGTVWTWSGTGSPTQVTGLSRVVSISAKYGNILAIESDGTLWSYCNGAQIAGFTTTGLSQITGLGRVVAVATGYDHDLVVRSDGSVLSWGINTDGCLGNPYIGASASSSAPATVSDLSLNTNPYHLAVGGSSSEVIRNDGLIWSCGLNTSGQLGTGGPSTLVPVQNPTNWSALSVSTGPSSSAAVKFDGTLWTWGNNASGQLGDGTTKSSILPITVSSLSGVLSTASGGTDTVVVKGDHTIWSFGNNSSGQLGTGNTTSSQVPVTIATSALNGDALQVDSGTSHTLALKGDGTVWSWGNNQYGQLGNGTTTSNSTPAQITALAGSFVAIAAGGSHSIALKNDGTVWVWGYNADGELGNSTTTNSTSPIAVANLTNVIAIGATAKNSYALKADGTVWSWGAGTSGQLGNGSVANSTSPVSASISNVVSLATGSSANHILVSRTDGTIWGWGDNTGGDLGDGTSTQRASPVEMGSLDVLQSPSAATITSSSGVYQANGNIPLSASVPSGSDPIVSVAFYQGTTLIGRATTLPFSVTWTNVAAGTYSVTAVTTDTEGYTTTSSPILLKVMRVGYDSVAAANNNSFVVRSDGTVWAWGQNNLAALGTGSLNEQVGPTWVAGLPSVKSISVAGAHGLAITGSGSVWAWGDNVNGDLGIGTTVQTSIAKQIPSLSNVVQVATGDLHSVALTSDGTVWTWGGNTSGQLGNGNNTASSVPLQISPTVLNGVVSIAARGSETLALKSDGTVWSWGLNSTGQLGIGSTTNSNIPVQITSLSNVIAISVGAKHAGAVEANGSLWTWGDNSVGELGNNTLTQSTSPVQITTVTGITTIQLGDNVSSAIKSDGTVYVWGSNSAGQLGMGTTTAYYTIPQTAANWVKTYQFAFGSNHALGLGPNGSVLASGSQTNAQLGNGTVSSTNLTAPVGVQSLFGILGIANGNAHTLDFKNDGTLWAWGQNTLGQLGNDSITSSLVPVQASTLTTTVGVSAGTGFSLALGSDGSVSSWGSNSRGQLGIPIATTQRNVPAIVVGLSGFVQVSAGSDFSAGLRSDGTVWLWGANNHGQLGIGTTTDNSVPVQATGLSGIVQISAGSEHMMALASDGTVWTWGRGDNGELGNSTTADSTTPVHLTTLSNIARVVAGTNFSEAVGNIANGGTLYTWGYDSDGELGNGATTQQTSPQTITTSVIEAGVNGGTTVIEKSTQATYSWGLNTNGQVGNGTTTNVLSPYALTSYAETIFASGSSSHHSILELANQTIYAWGDNVSGDLGDGTSTQRISPVVATSVGNLPPTVAPVITLTEPDGATLL